MARAPSPVLGRLLKSLEIKDASECRTYESDLGERTLNLTLDAQFTRKSAPENLVLYVYHGIQQLVFLDLSEILRTSRSIPDIVRIGKTQRIVEFRLQERTVTATFHEARDFNVTVCILEKSGFRLNNMTLPVVEVSAHMNSTQSHFQGTNWAPTWGPRLSAIAHLPVMGLTYPPGALEKQMSAPVMDDYLPSSQSPHHLHQHDMYHAVSPGFLLQPSLSPHRQDQAHSVSPTFNLPSINPYNFFLAQQGSVLHQPPVSSPLRHSASLGENGVQPSVPASLHPSGTDSQRNRSNALSLSSKQLDKKIPEAMLSEESMLPVTQVNEPDPQPQSPPSKAVLTPLAQTSKDFRDELPQPRNLPFSLVSRKRGRSDAPESTKDSRKSPKEKAERSRKEPNSKHDSEPESKKRKVQPEGQRTSQEDNETGDVDISVDINSASSHRDSHAPTGPDTARPSFGDDFVDPELALRKALQPTSKTQISPLVVLTDPSLLRQANETTLNLFKQYEEDIERGCDSSLCAQFYMDQILAARRSFWYTKLLQMNHNIANGSLAEGKLG